MSPGLRLVLVPLTSLATFIVVALLVNAWDAIRQAIHRWERLRGIQAAARQRGWFRDRAWNYDAAWIDQRCHRRAYRSEKVDQWVIFGDPTRRFDNEADALEAALKENP